MTDIKLTGKVVMCPCGKEFYCRRSYNRIYCSMKCARAYRRYSQGVSKICLNENCKKEFRVFPSQVANRKYCCRACIPKHRFILPDGRQLVKGEIIK